MLPVHISVVAIIVNELLNALSVCNILVEVFVLENGGIGLIAWDYVIVTR